MNIFEERIADRYGLPKFKESDGVKYILENIVIIDGLINFNYTCVLPSTIKQVNVDFKFYFPADDKT